MEHSGTAEGHEPKYLLGEKPLSHYNNVHEQNRNGWVDGTLYLTNYRVVFLPSIMSSYDDMPQYERTSIPLMMIHRVIKVGGKSSRQEHSYLIELHTKNFRIVRFSFLPSQRIRRKVFEFLVEHTIFTLPAHCFCFSHKVPVSNGAIDGWNVFNVEREFRRQGLVFPSHSTSDVSAASPVSSGSSPPASTPLLIKPQEPNSSLRNIGSDPMMSSNGITINNNNNNSINSIPNSLWRISEANVGFALCDTYAQLIVVPASITDDELRVAASFRSRQRLPCLSWYNQRTGATLTRSAQPMTGIMRNRNETDQKLMDAINRSSTNVNQPVLHTTPTNSDENSSSSSSSTTTTTSTTPGNPPLSARSAGDFSEFTHISNDVPTLSSQMFNIPSKLIIIDLRPRANAEANRAIGFGYEIIHHYKNCELKFMGIDNVHVMRESLRKLMELIIMTGGSDIQWLSKLEATNWLEHIRNILNTSRFVADCLEKEKCSVLTHCSDGWDRTSQVLCLSQIMLDPYYRTLEGLAVLIEKEWVQFGHRFRTRCGHGMRNFWDDHRGPIFLQFIDALYQMLQQHPCSFEFTEQFLIFLLDSLYSCQYGTFLFDSMKECLDSKAPQLSTSIWTHVLNNKQQFLNSFYSPETKPMVIYPNTAHSGIRLWTDYYLRFCRHNEATFAPLLPSQEMVSRGLKLLTQIEEREIERQKSDVRTETTIMAFQKELKVMQSDRDRLSRELAALQTRHQLEVNEWKRKYEHDTKQLLELCEQQREELSLWILKSQQQQQQQQQQMHNNSTPNDHHHGFQFQPTPSTSMSAKRSKALAKQPNPSSPAALAQQKQQQQQLRHSIDSASSPSAEFQDIDQIIEDISRQQQQQQERGEISTDGGQFHFDRGASEEPGDTSSALSEEENDTEETLDGSLSLSMTEDATNLILNHAADEDDEIRKMILSSSPSAHATDLEAMDSLRKERDMWRQQAQYFQQLVKTSNENSGKRSRRTSMKNTNPMAIVPPPPPPSSPATAVDISASLAENGPLSSDIAVQLHRLREFYEKEIAFLKEQIRGTSSAAQSVVATASLGTENGISLPSGSAQPQSAPDSKIPAASTTQITTAVVPSSSSLLSSALRYTEDYFAT